MVDTVTTEINQVSSFTFWRPVDRRWTVSAGARAYTMAGENSAQSSDQTSFGATAGAFYQYSKRLRFDGSVNFSKADINGADQTQHRERVGALLQSGSGRMAEFYLSVVCQRRGGKPERCGRRRPVGTGFVGS